MSIQLPLSLGMIAIINLGYWTVNPNMLKWFEMIFVKLCLFGTF